ncbi:MAG: threonine--tRNA ligase, partial [Candidatus Magasanikbacteria bacterium]|nr:threonine--tRNA ligase [Candidatus Magasanikbacteria bacterium]
MFQEKIELIRHSCSHLMSMAIMEKYPTAGLGVGPTIEDGFYQDYDLPEVISEKDFIWIEKRMRELIAKKIKFIQSEVDFKSSLEYYKNDPYKTELINDLQAKGEKKVSFYDSDWFHNLCAGPHVADTGEINPEAFKLMSVAGAYWRGSEKNKMLTRIYGVAFETKKELEEFLRRQEEAEKRDHRKLGVDLDLFVFSDLVGRGLPLLTPKGTVIRKELEKFVYEEEVKRGYKHVVTPHLAKVQLYQTSGHYPYYKDTMYPVMKVDEDELILRPMTCPHHFMLFKSRPRSYRELPLRLAEFASQFRYEKSG